MRRLSLAFVLILAFSGMATAAPPPRNASYVDPQAPCFRWPAVDYDADGVFDRIDHCTNTPAGCTVDKWGCESDADGDGVCDGPNAVAGQCTAGPDPCPTCLLSHYRDPGGSDSNAACSSASLANRSSSSWAWVLARSRSFSRSV